MLNLDNLAHPSSVILGSIQPSYLSYPLSQLSHVQPNPIHSNSVLYTQSNQPHSRASVHSVNLFNYSSIALCHAFYPFPFIFNQSVPLIRLRQFSLTRFNSTIYLFNHIISLCICNVSHFTYYIHISLHSLYIPPILHSTQRTSYTAYYMLIILCALHTYHTPHDSHHICYMPLLLHTLYIHSYFAHAIHTICIAPLVCCLHTRPNMYIYSVAWDLGLCVYVSMVLII